MPAVARSNQLAAALGSPRGVIKTGAWRHQLRNRPTAIALLIFKQLKAEAVLSLPLFFVALTLVAQGTIGFQPVTCFFLR